MQQVGSHRRTLSREGGGERISLHFDKTTLAAVCVNCLRVWPLSLLTVLRFLWDTAVAWLRGSYAETFKRGFQLWLDLSLEMLHPSWPLLLIPSGDLVLNRTTSSTTFTTKSFIGWGILLALYPEYPFPLKLPLNSFKTNMYFFKDFV